MYVPDGTMCQDRLCGPDFVRRAQTIQRTSAVLLAVYGQCVIPAVQAQRLQLGSKSLIHFLGNVCNVVCRCGSQPVWTLTSFFES